MAKINNKVIYPLEQYPDLKDYLIGSKELGGKTMNFPLIEVLHLFKTSVDINSIQYLFSTGSNPEIDYYTQGAFFTDNNETNPNNFSKIILNKLNVSGEDLTELFNFFAVTDDLVLTFKNPSDPNNFFQFKVTNVDNQVDYFVFDVTILINNYIGELQDGNYYNIEWQVYQDLTTKADLSGAVFTGDVEAPKFIVTGGLATQFLKADGSLDNNSYALVSDLHDPVTLGTANGLSLVNQVLSLALATSSQNGALSSTDWTTFNNKQDFLVSGTNIKTIEGQSIIGAGNIDLNKNDVGLGNVDNTSDADKPVSTAQQAALNLKADLASPVFTGNPTAPTPLPNDNDNSIATTAFVTGAIGTLDGNVLHKTGNETKTGNLTVNSIIRAGGTANQFLKADGSIDSNIYLTTETDTLQAVTTRGAVTTTSITALSFIKSGGLASQFLKADGSIDSTVYAVDADVLHKTGNEIKTGTLTVNSIIKSGGIASQYLMADGTVTTAADIIIPATQVTATPHVDYLVGANVQLQLDQTETNVVGLYKIDKTDDKTLKQTGRYRPDTDVSVLSISPANTLNITACDNILFVNEIMPDVPANKVPDFLKSFGNKSFEANGTNTPLAADTRGIFYVGLDKLGNQVYRTAKIYDQDVAYMARILVNNTAGVYTIVSAKYFPDLANNRVNNRDRLVLSSGYIVPSGAASISFGNRGMTYSKNSINYSNNKLDPNYLTIADSVNPTPMSFLFFLPNITSLAVSIATSTVIDPTVWYTAGGAVGVGAVNPIHYQVYKLFITVTGTIAIQTKASTTNFPEAGVNAIFATREAALAGLTSTIFPDILPVGDSIALGTFYLRAGTAVNGSTMTDPNDFYFRPFTATSSSSSIGVTVHDLLSGKNDNPAFQHVTTTDIANWNIAYTNRITSLTTTGTSGAATLISNVLNIPVYAPQSGSGNYIQNQFASAQPANMWINGVAQATSFIKNGAPAQNILLAGGGDIAYSESAIDNTIVRRSGSGLALIQGGYLETTLANTDATAIDTFATFTSASGVIRKNSIGAVQSVLGINGGSFILNQNASAQSANMWISGSGRFEGNLTVGNTTGGTFISLRGAESGDIRLENVGNTVNGILRRLRTSWYSDTFDYSVYRGSGSDILKGEFAHNGNSVLTMRVSGDIGMGTVNPNARLHSHKVSPLSIGGELTYSAFFSNDDVNKGVIIGYDSTNNLGVISSIWVGNAWTNLSLLPNNGNLLVGTVTNTGHKLNVAGPSNLNGTVETHGNLYSYGGVSVGTAGGRTGALATNNAIAIGDADTGFLQAGDGVLDVYCNGVFNTRFINGATMIGTTDYNGVARLQVGGTGYFNSNLFTDKVAITNLTDFYNTGVVSPQRVRIGGDGGQVMKIGPYHSAGQINFEVDGITGTQNQAGVYGAGHATYPSGALHSNYPIIGGGTSSKGGSIQSRNDVAGANWWTIENQEGGGAAYASLLLAASGNTWGIENGSAVRSGNALEFVLDPQGGRSTKMVIRNTGKVGINYLTPQSRLEVEAGLQSDSIVAANSAAYFRGSDVGVAFGQFSASGNYASWMQSIRNYDNATFALSLNPAGSNVLIGKFADDGGGSNKLQVNGNITAYEGTAQNHVVTRSQIDRKLNNVFLGNPSDYYRTVVLLHKLDNSDPSATHAFSGQVYIRRFNGLYTPVIINITSQKVYNDTYALGHYSIENKQGFVDVVTFNYNGIKWLGAIVTVSDASPGINVFGDWTQEPILVPYYNNNGGTILNNEIYSSITPHTYGGNQLFDGTITVTSNLYASGGMSVGTAGNRAGVFAGTVNAIAIGDNDTGILQGGDGFFDIYSNGIFCSRHSNGRLLVGDGADNGSDRLQVHGGSKMNGSLTLTSEIYFNTSNSYLRGVNVGGTGYRPLIGLGGASSPAPDKVIVDADGVGSYFQGNAHFASGIYSGAHSQFGNGSGNTYSTCSLELIGNGPSNSIFPTLGFHQPSMFAGEISMKSNGAFTFTNGDGSQRASIVVNNINASALADGSTTRTVVALSDGTLSTIPTVSGIQCVIIEGGWAFNNSCVVSTGLAVGKTILLITSTLRCIATWSGYQVGDIASISPTQPVDSGGLDDSGITVRYRSDDPTKFTFVINNRLDLGEPWNGGVGSCGNTSNPIVADNVHFNVRHVIFYI